MVIVEEPAPGAGMDVGLKLTVAPEGCPEALSAIAESNPIDTIVVIVTVAEDPGATFTELGVGVITKSGVATVTDTFVVCVIPPPVPVTVMM